MLIIVKDVFHLIENFSSISIVTVIILQFKWTVFIGNILFRNTNLTLQLFKWSFKIWLLIRANKRCSVCVSVCEREERERVKERERERERKN